MYAALYVCMSHHILKNKKKHICTQESVADGWGNAAATASTVITDLKGCTSYETWNYPNNARLCAMSTVFRITILTDT